MNNHNSFEINGGIYDMGQIIIDMLDEGYDIKEISISGEIYKGNLIKFIDFFTYVCVEFVHGELLFAPLHKIDFIVLVENEDE